MLKFYKVMVLQLTLCQEQTSLIGYKYWTPSRECAILLGLWWQNNFNNNNIRRKICHF